MTDRSKASQIKRPLKGKAGGSALPPGDLFALGSKPSRPGGDSGFQKSDRKREPSSLLVPTAVKKPKILAQGQTFTPLGRPSDRDADRRSSPIPPLSHQYEDAAIEVESGYFVDEVLAAEESGDEERLEGLLCGAVKHLHSNRSKPDPILYLALMHLAKARPAVFNSELVIEAFCTLLRRDMSLNFKSKGNAIVSVLTCNMLMRAFVDEDNWPDDFVKVYIDDALGERVWVDRADCKGFVDNVITAFNTSLPKGGLGSLDSKGDQAGGASPSITPTDDDEMKMEVDIDKASNPTAESQNVPTQPRFPYQADNIESSVMEIIREQLVKRQLMDASAKSLIRLMTVTCGYGEVRQLAAGKLELWLQNPKLGRASQELLMSVCMNCSAHDAYDMEVIATLIKMRMKTKPLLNHYLVCIREMLGQHTENLRMVLTHTIYNELSNARNPNNMALIGVVFQTKAEVAARILAEIFQDLLANKDDYLRALRALFREIVRTLRHELNFTAFCLSLMQERTEPKFTDMETAYRERYVSGVQDLACMCTLQAITPSVREAVAAVAKGDMKDIEVVHNFQDQVATIQRDSIWWLHTIVPKFLDPIKPQEYNHWMRKALFLEPADQYSKDNWPAEADRGSMLRLVSEVPVLEDTLMRVLVIGLSRELPLVQADALEFADALIRRAANLHSEGRQVIHIERLELFDALLNLCTYRHPENIALPAGYTPPQLAISNLYWKAWIILLIISAFNPSTFGLSAWENYPTLKCIFEMVMTNNYKFPPPTTAADDSLIEEFRNKEIQEAQREKQEILEFEGYLAASTTKVTITEANSLLIAQLTSMDPNGIARKPTQHAMEQLRNLNDSLKIGQMLCRSRNPDFLLDIIQRQGTSQSMPWLAELVESSEGSLDVLPVQCLCEFLLHETQQDAAKDGTDDESAKFERHKRKQKIKKQQQLLSRLQTLVHDADADSSTTHEVMDYFLKRLASTQAANRALATRGLSMIVSRSQISPTEETPSGELSDGQTHTWLLRNLPALPMFPQVKLKTCQALRQAIQIEADPSLVSAYIIFLSQHTLELSLQELNDLALDIAQPVVERMTIMNYMLPQGTGPASEVALDTLGALILLFVNYLRKAKEPNQASYSWSNTQDQILLQWESGESATLHILVVHAMVILLSYGPARDEAMYQELLETWFPAKGKPPSAFLLDTSEEALLLPDWLKLRMIRSNAEPLINAALQDLESSQLLLFVQSFGIPVHSMSKLLSCLDVAVSQDQAGVLEASVVDKAYMAQLVQVQHNRGAKGGDKFFSMLTGGERLVLKQDDVEMQDEPTDDSSWRCHGDVSPEMVPASFMVNTLLQAFDPSGRKSPDAETHFRSLVMSVTKDGRRTLDVVKGLQEILTGSSGSEFSKILMQSNKACCLLKLLISKQSQPGVRSSLLKVMDRLAHFSRGQKSLLSPIVHQYLASSARRGQRSKSGPAADPAKTKPQLRMTDEKVFQEDLQTLASGDTTRLEQLIGDGMRRAMATSNTEAGARLACSVLAENQAGSTRGGMLASTGALLVDWLELLDLEVVSRVPDLQEHLLFARHQRAAAAAAAEGGAREEVGGASEDGGRRLGSSQPYLLALLTHQASWTTLHRTIESLLGTEGGNTRYDPTSVLDFLSACVHIPKIWQGRERKVPKNRFQEDILGLKDSQLFTIVDYIILEASGTQSGTRDQSSTNQISITINNRMEFLRACISSDNDRVKHLVECIEKKKSQKGNDTPLYDALMLGLYLQYPFLLAWLSDTSSIDTAMASSQHTQTQMDLIAHRLITGLYTGARSKSTNTRMSDVNIACRKLAAKHPVLLLRQLPAIVALLKGKTQFTFGEFRQRSLLTLFSYILGLLELLEPGIFHREHGSLHDILEEYFNMLKAYSMDHYKQMGPIIVKFVSFLNQYMDHDSQRASTLLQKHAVLLGHVSSVYPDLSLLKSILAGLTLPRHSSQEETTPTTPSSSTAGDEPSRVMYPARPSSPWSVSHLMPFLLKIKKENSEEVLTVLQDLDETSKRKLEILGHFVEDLKRLMLAYNDQCRNTAFELVKRYLKQNPRQVSEFVPIYLHCLESSNPDVVTSALTNLAEFTLLCQDYADVILQKAFSAGITTSVETSSYISESLQLLNLELAST